jgi:alginate O-acetyltransferase complex protein AlgI
MLFCSQKFLLFFAVVFAVYWTLPWHRARVALLLVASFWFYASWNRWLALLVAGSAALDYAVGLGLEASRRPAHRRGLLAASLAVNLGVLFTFKYANFFLESLAQLLRTLGAEASLPVLRVLLPVGISFYTFEAINYTVDVYRRRVTAERNLMHFLVFILFFPHLVAGPIVRARDFLPQLRRPKRWDWLRLQLGVQLFLMGLFKKLAIADRMAQFADPVFAEPGTFGSAPLWIATVAYALQIYGDFSGYTDMALGCAHMFGYKLAPNFRMPYLSANVSEFWRRWHISLSSWLRDYVFIPLGGSRGSSLRTAINLMVTMTVGGLWHGASWTFVVWGALHGALLVVHRGFRALCRRHVPLDDLLQTAPATAVRVTLTFLAVSLAWVIFRASSFSTALIMLRGLFVVRTGRGAPCPVEGFWLLVALVVLAHLMAQRGLAVRTLRRLPAPILGCGYALVLALALILAPDATRPFVYFQF